MSWYVGVTNLPTYGYVSTYLYVYLFKIQLICRVATFDCATCCNLKPSKMNNHNVQWISIFLKTFTQKSS